MKEKLVDIVVPFPSHLAEDDNPPQWVIDLTEVILQQIQNAIQLTCFEDCRPGCVGCLMEFMQEDINHYLQDWFEQMSDKGPVVYMSLLIGYVRETAVESLKKMPCENSSAAPILIMGNQTEH